MSADDRDFVEATAAQNAKVLAIANRVKVAADEAVAARDVDELIAALSETVDLLDHVVEDLVGSRAQGCRGVRQRPNVPASR